MRAWSAGGRVLGVLPQREARALQCPGESVLAGAPRVVPHLATDLVQRVGPARCCPHRPAAVVSMTTVM